MHSCRVYWRDRSGIEHAAYVKAANRFHAFGLAMHEMRKCSWCNPDYREVQEMTIQIMDGAFKGKRFTLTRDQFEVWLAIATPRKDRNREYVLMLLGRIPQDRDFKAGKKVR